ncbi:hypothetical protein OO014_11795 [Intrasporangium calvum]|uniref:YD repeat protein n=1 Tax=Intrasporangium calvum TaxID=53358 RepID=A0ABT5GIM4_9MICO|nr:SpvB/TcaC N-terminal domain-containing protein [Intrasporangium calvum]MDC5697944.1 hypothetical protein [Intrasporangium calvum]
MPSYRHASTPSNGSTRRSRLRRFPAVALALLLALTTGAPAALGATPFGGLVEATLPGTAPTSPQELGEGATADLLYADVTEGLSQIQPPEANAGGSAQLSYPIALPQGRGDTPELALTYDSGGGSSWAGLGWDISVGEVAVDTSFGSPRFCDGTAKSPPCGNVESESYTLDGDPLVPNAVRAVLEPRVAERQDFTRRVETEFEQIIRHGTKPSDYWWEVRDKKGGVRFYGGAPDSGGPFGRPGVQAGLDDKSRMPSGILADAQGNGVRWMLTAQRDIGVNLVRYEYETVLYRRSTSAATGWVPVAPGMNCPSGQACPKHVFLSKILYTAGATASGQPEDATYEVRFVRKPGGRTDARLDGRGGVLDLDQDLLDRIDVVHRPSSKVVTRYALDYDSDPHFGKRRLKSVTQIGCNGLATCPTDGQKHTFAYHDDIAAAGSGFDTPTTWQTGDQPAGPALVPSKLSALGTSATNAGDGRIYVGFNPASPSKTGSAGGSFAMNGATNESLIEFMDLNGDSLPDKVYRKTTDLVTEPSDGESMIRYQLNTTKPTTAPTTGVTFGPMHELKGFSRLPVQRSIGIQGGIEAYFGVYGVFNVGGQWSWVDSYFTDANGDGLPDLVRGSEVLFNHLVCGPPTPGVDPVDQCLPTFSASDANTRVPLTSSTISVTDPSFQQMVDRLREAIPPVDTVQRWTAPFTGTVQVTAKATLQAPPDEDTAAGSVRLAIQYADTEKATGSVSETSPTWQPANLSIAVTKGQAIYFRTGSRPLGNGDTVTWEADIAYAGGPALDANGLDQRRYSLEDDFTLAGRPGLFTAVGNGGTASFRTALHKTAVTSDDFLPQVIVRRADGTSSQAAVTVTPVTAGGAVDAPRVKTVTQQSGEWCVADATTSFGCYATEADAQLRAITIGKAETGRFRITASPSINAPVVDGNGVMTGFDAVQTRLAVDSPVALTAIDWLEPAELCFKTGGECDETKTRISPHMDLDTYPHTDLSGPASAWSSTLGRTVTPVLKGSLGADNPGGDLVVTAKTAAGVVYKQVVPVGAGTGTLDEDLADLSLTNGTGYWFDVTVRNPGISANLSGVNLVLEWKEGALDKSADPPETLNWAGAQGFFPVAYRGWAAAGYTALGAKSTTKIDEAAFLSSAASGDPYEDKDEACQALYGGACPDDSSVNDTGFGDYPTGSSSSPPPLDLDKATEEVPDAFAYRPVVQTSLTERWEGPKAKIFAAQGGRAGSARVGEDLPMTSGSSGAVSAPNLLGETGPIFMLMAGIGPLSGSFAAGWARSLVDYLDMNGDGFPDTVRPGSIDYTNPRGTQECGPQSARVTCTGGGVTTVNSSTTLAVSGGFGGAPIGISGNSKGTTNSTKGNSAGKGQSASDSSFGGNIGGSLGGGASFTNPTANNPQQNADALDDVPRQGGLPTQETIADINGDGLPDRITVTNDVITVRLNLGHSFAPAVEWVTGAFSSTNSYSGSVGASLGVNIDNMGFSAGVSKNANVDLPNVAWEDVNGDGLLDALYNTSDGIKVAFSSGTGLTGSAVYGTHASLDYPIVGPIEAEGQQQIRQDTSESLGGGVDVTVGIPLCAVACYLILNPGGHYENSLTSTDVDLVDVNGDGYADTVRRVKDSGKIEVSLNTQGRTNLLKSVTTPLGGTMSLDYRRDGNTTLHPGSEWVLTEVKVASSRGADGIAEHRKTISYGTLRYDFVQRASLGYDVVTESDHFQRWEHTDLANPTQTAAARTTVHRFHNLSVFEAGLEYETTVLDGAATGTPMQRTRTTWDLKDLDLDGSGSGYAPLNLAGRTVDALLATRATAQVSKVEQDWYAAGVLEQTTTMTYAYDRLGNPRTVVDTGLPGTSADDTVATIDYADCTSSASAALVAEFGCGATLKTTPTRVAPYWSSTACPTWNAQPVAIQVKAPNGTILRSRDGRQDYCDNNAVTLFKELLTPAGGGNPAAYAETRLGFDAYGSYNRIVLPPDADGKRYAVRYLYDDVNHANVAQVTDFELVGSGDPQGTDDADTTRKFIKDDVQPTGAAVGITTNATFDGPTGRVASRKDANGNETKYTYDAYSRIRTITSPDGGVATFAYHPDDPDYPYATVTHTDQLNPGTTIDTATYADGSGRVTGRKRDAVVYDPVTGATGPGFAAEGGSDVDGLGRTIHEWKPFLQSGKTLADYTVDASNPGLDLATITTYDALDRVTEERLSNGATTRTTYGFEVLTGSGKTATIDVTDPRGRHTKTWLDAYDNVLVTEDKSAPVADDPGTPGDESDPGGVPLRTTFTYDRMGQLLTAVSPGNLTTTHTYDLLGRRTSTTTPDGGLVDWTYDLAGNKTSEQSPVLREENNVRTRFGYDFGLLTSITYPDEPPVTLDFGGYLGNPTVGNAAGRLVHVEDKARVQDFAYDANGRLAKDVTTTTGPHPNTGPFTTDYANDWLGRLATVSLPDGEVVTNGYDAGGRLSRVTGSKDCRELGVLTAAIDALQTTITVTEYEHADPASAFAPTLPFTITIDGEQLRVTARVPGAVAGTFDYTVERGINGTLEVPTATGHGVGASVMADAAVTCFYRYLDLQRYDVYGEVSQRRTGNGVTDTTYRDVHTRRLDQRTAVSPDGSQELMDLRYTYDLVGNVRQVENHLPADVPSLFGGPTRQKYWYDGRYRLAAAEGTWSYAPKTTRNYTWAATLDDATSKVKTMAQRDWTVDTGCTKRCTVDLQEATTFDRTAYTYDPSKPYQATSVYDAVTKLTEEYEYDSDGEQTKVTNPDMIRDVAWDWAGKMVSVVDHNAQGIGRKQTDYVYDYAGQLATEIKEQGVTYYLNPWVTVRNGTMSKNIWAGNDRLAVKFVDTDTYETRLYFLHKDLQGSTNIVTRRDGKVFQHQEYFPTGQVWIREDSTIFRTPYQFAGGYTDEDHGLINFGERWYSPQQARFLTVEPLLTEEPLALVENPTLIGAYTYGQSNPTSYVDTDGRTAMSVNEVINTISSLTPGGDPIKSDQLTKLSKFFAKNMDTARGRQGLFWLKSFNKYDKRMKTYFNRLDSRPVLEFEFEDGKLKAIKLGFGVGPRKKFDMQDKGSGSTGGGGTGASPTTGGAPPGDQQGSGSSTSPASSGGQSGPPGQGSQSGQTTQPSSSSPQSGDGGQTQPANPAGATNNATDE